MKKSIRIIKPGRPLLITNKYVSVLLVIALYFSQILYSVGQTIPIQSSIESIAKYTNLGSDRTASLLAEIGFNPPENLKLKWDRFPAVRKIETAYLAVDGNSGERMLALLANNLAQRYESVRYEHTLTTLLDKFSFNTEEKILFKNLSSIESSNIPISSSVREPIMAITKYSDARALGGSTGILKNYFNLTDKKVYDILRSSSDNYDALIKGINSASIPPSQRDRLIKIVKELQKSYQAAQTDAALNKISRYYSSEKMPQGTVLNENKQLIRIEDQYKNYQERHFKTESSRKFQNMKMDTKTYGGVVFGNNVSTSASLINKKLKYIKWIEAASDKPGESVNGSLEFEFFDGSVKVTPSILLEDIYAAHRIIFDDNGKSKYLQGDGIGLAGANYLITDTSSIKVRKKFLNEPINSEKYYMENYDWDYVNDSLYGYGHGYEFFFYKKCVLHPAIANLELGRSLIRCDLWLRTGRYLKNKLLISRPTPTEVTILDKWLIGHESNGWKYTDAPMFIGSDINFINVAPLKASSELRLNASCILFNFVSEKDTTYTEFKGFKYIMPLLTKSLEDFDRLNNFSKVLALVRWAAINNAIFLNKPTEPSFLNKPLVIKADDTGISIFDTVKEVRASYGYK